MSIYWESNARTKASDLMTTGRKVSALVVVVAAAASFVWASNHMVSGSRLNRAANGAAPAGEPPQSQNYSRFKHDNPQHARLPCLLCHRRETNSAQPSLPGKSNHAPCT